jgi:hypothetical protein
MCVCAVVRVRYLVTLREVAVYDPFGGVEEGIERGRHPDRLALGLGRFPTCDGFAHPERSLLAHLDRRLRREGGRG